MTIDLEELLRLEADAWRHTRSDVDSAAGLFVHAAHAALPELVRELSEYRAIIVGGPDMQHEKLAAILAERDEARAEVEKRVAEREAAIEAGQLWAHKFRELRKAAEALLDKLPARYEGDERSNAAANLRALLAKGREP